MKKLLFIIMFLLAGAELVRADHITGGEMHYNYVGFSNNLHTYRISIKLFMTCNDNRRFNAPAIVSVFQKSNNVRLRDIDATLLREERMMLDQQDPCITDAPMVCFRVGFYEFYVSVPTSAEGYIVSMQVVFRVNGISNLITGYNNIGATYTAELPGNGRVSDAAANNSARFSGNDLVVVCANNSFTYDFGAVDPDGDELRYSFCSALQGGRGGFGNDPQPPETPPYQAVPYGIDYSGAYPLGNNVRIDQRTGRISGLAPGSGIYVVTVCVEEIRNGQVIATQRKDLQISITSCSIAAASLQPEYQLCKESSEITIVNRSTSDLIRTLNWNIIDPEGKIIFNTDDRDINYRFTDTGLYRVRLAINRGQQCADSMESTIKVYPGMKADFDNSGICIKNPIRFTDKSIAGYGEISKWQWEFDLLGFNGGISFDRNPDFNYQRTGEKTVRLISTTSKGCADTAIRSLSIIEKPPVHLAFRDTLICLPDELQLFARGDGEFRWSPDLQILNPLSKEPLVRPEKTTMYYVDVSYQGCESRDSVLVKVTDRVEIASLADTLICAGDEVEIFPESNALKYFWETTATIDDKHSSRPKIRAGETAAVLLTGQIGQCSATQNFIIQTVPYPLADAGSDTIICYNSPVYLQASTNGNKFSWSDGRREYAQNLSWENIPARSGYFVFTAFDDLGCPKPGIDSVYIQVLDEVKAFAGKDTAVVMNQPLQLHASGGLRYYWSPAINLSAADIANPVAIFRELSPDIRYQLIAENEAGCQDTAYLRIRIFNAAATVFVPNAFTPNNDGVNDELRFVAAGIRKIQSFQVFNRWGHIVYSSNTESRGWDGNIAGRPQASGTYVWLIKAIDYLGNSMIKKGTVLLIR